MKNTNLSILAAILSLLLLAVVHSAPVVPDAVRVRRSSADQRIAELQALLALSGSGSRGRERQVIAHGLFDPDKIGKKKRGDPEFTQQATDAERYNLLRSLITRAAYETS